MKEVNDFVSTCKHKNHTFFHIKQRNPEHKKSFFVSEHKY